MQPSLSGELTRTGSPFKPYRPPTPQLRSGGGEQHGRLMSAASSDPDAELPFRDWEVEGEALEVCRHPDGAPVVLGQGSFGTVSLLPYIPSLASSSAVIAIRRTIVRAALLPHSLSYRVESAPGDVCTLQSLIPSTLSAS